MVWCCSGLNAQQHPCLYANSTDRPSILSKITEEEWAKTAWNHLLQEITPYADKHQTDPEWIVSRLAMYWKEGERYTQCYLKRQNWDRGEGNAPVPTVRMPGMRTWNEYINVPLKDRTPYNETGDMWGISRKDPDQPPVLIPYKNSGHMIRGNNREILSIAAKSAFIYFLVREEKYARLSADIYNTWLLGTYYMNPILDPDRSTRGPGGYEPGGICGYYDYEQIHDDLALEAAPIYDFLYNYLNENPHPHLQIVNKNITEISGIVFKRFVDIGMVRGGNTGNWNVNGWNMMMRPILVLESNSYYPDGKGREYYLQYYTTTTTKYHDALPDILTGYDPVTGLWPESPGYALGTINTLVDMAIPIYKAGVNTIRDNPTLHKAAMAVFPWIDARGNIVVFGDTRGGQGNYRTFERLLTYYKWIGDEDHAATVAAVLHKSIRSGQYHRGNCDWEDLILNIPKIEGDVVATKTERMAYSPFHRHLVMKNGNDEKNALMATIYGGTKGHHLTSNGLAIQLYGMGWALGPDASGYESYWSPDMAYHQSATGCNTIIPGYTEGDIIINAMEPEVPANSFANTTEISPNYSFADISAGEKRRLIAIIRTSSSTGYYIDIFRSNQDDNDYIYHNVGNGLSLKDEKGNNLPITSANDLGNRYGRGYDYFTNQKKTEHTKAFQAQWQINSTPHITMDMWMLGQDNRAIYTVDAPYTNISKGVTPGNISIAPQSTPTLIVRQNGNDAWKSPFVAVFEPYESQKKSIKQITNLSQNKDFICLLVENNPMNENRKDYILNAIDDKKHVLSGNIGFNGTFGIISENSRGIQSLYLGKGSLLEKGKYGIKSDKPVYASLTNKNGVWYYSSNSEINITIGGKSTKVAAGYDQPVQ